MKDKYLILKVKQEKNVIIIKVVNIPGCASVNKRLVSMPLGANDDDRDNCFFLRTSSLHHCPCIMNGTISYGLILPGPRDDVNAMNYASYQFACEGEANIYLSNLSKAVALYNEHIRYKEADNNYIATNEWTVMQ